MEMDATEKLYFEMAELQTKQLTDISEHDTFIDEVERKAKGAYYTPLKAVDLAYGTLDKCLGKDWQENYVVWDMCCGTGNLLRPHSHYHNVFMSTLDQEDVDAVTGSSYFNGAIVFQYDYLNDDVTDDGGIDYTLTNKVPQKLRDAIASGRKILVLINPPYAESGNPSNVGQGSVTTNKTGVAKTKWCQSAMADYGRAKTELFIQFMVRVAKEMPNAVLAMFSKPKYMNGTSSEKFRERWNATFMDGFIFDSRAFSGVSGAFPIGFLVWQTDQNGQRTPMQPVEVPMYNKSLTACGTKVLQVAPERGSLRQFVASPSPNKEPALPLSSAVKVSSRANQPAVWSDGAVGYMSAGLTDMQNVNYVYLLSSTAARGGGFYVNKDNVLDAAVTFTVQRILEHEWYNDNDRFQMPCREPDEEFKTDCLVWMLWHGKNLTAGADGIDFDGKQWSLVNHFVPYMENEIGAYGPYDSYFLINLLAEVQLSKEAAAVMDKGKRFWCQYFDGVDRDSDTVKQKYRLGRSDVGWYQVRRALEERGELDIDWILHDYSVLTNKLKPQVVKKYEFIQGAKY